MRTSVVWGMSRETIDVNLEGNLFSTLAVYARISGVLKNRKLIGKSGEPWEMIVVVGNESVRKPSNLVVDPPCEA